MSDDINDRRDAAAADRRRNKTERGRQLRLEKKTPSSQLESMQAALDAAKSALTDAATQTQMMQAQAQAEISRVKQEAITKANLQAECHRSQVHQLTSKAEAAAEAAEEAHASSEKKHARWVGTYKL